MPRTKVNMGMNLKEIVGQESFPDSISNDQPSSDIISGLNLQI